jgi:DnaJ-domain-containing protein 1
MTLGQRLWRLAKHRVRRGLGLEQGAPLRSSPAWRELENFLREAAQAAEAAAEQRSATRPGTTSRPSEASARPTARPASPPPHPYAAEYRLLQVPVGSDVLTVRSAWRKLVRETHPDRFAGDAEAQRKATERLRQINAAYEALSGYLATQKSA